MFKIAKTYWNSLNSYFSKFDLGFETRQTHKNFNEENPNASDLNVLVNSKFLGICFKNVKLIFKIKEFEFDVKNFTPLQIL
jgi:hypothetical protein